MTTKQMAKRNYERGLWTKEMLKALVRKEHIDFSSTDYEEITKEKYSE